MAMVATYKQLRDAVTLAERAIQKPPRKNSVLGAVEAFSFLEAYALANWKELPDQEKELLSALAYLVVEPPKVGASTAIFARLKAAWLLLAGRVRLEDLARLYSAASSYADSILTLVEQSSQDYQNMVSERIREASAADRNELIDLEELRERLLAD